MNDLRVFKSNLKALTNAIDYNNPITNDLAVRLASNFPGVREIKQICYIFDYVNSNWKYVLDSQKTENFRSASRTIQNNFAGDCDDYAILMAALLESIGFSTRISFAYNNELGGHAFAEVLVANKSEGDSQMQNIANWITQYYNTNQLYINWYTDEEGSYWLNLDWQGDFIHPGGVYFQWKYITRYYPTVQNPYFIDEENPHLETSLEDQEYIEEEYIEEEYIEEEYIEEEIYLPTIDSCHEIFNSLLTNHSIYIGNTIPTKKYNNFIKQFNLEYFKASENLIYYDSTIFGKGDNGFFIINNYSNVYFFYSSLEGTLFCVSLYNDNINGYIIEYRYDSSIGVVLNLQFPNTNSTYYNIYLDKDISKALVQFLDYVYNQ